MKKILFILSIILFFTGCSKTTSKPQMLDFEFDSDGNYIGFSDLPVDYTKKQATKDGCYVRKDSKAVAGFSQWKDFIQDTSDNKDTSIRIVNFYDDAIYFLDLYYIDGYYRVFDSSSDDLKDYKFKHLLTLKGQLPLAKKSGTINTLTDDPTLTYEDVMWTFLSSNSTYSESISPFKVVIME